MLRITLLRTGEIQLRASIFTYWNLKNLSSSQTPTAALLSRLVRYSRSRSSTTATTASAGTARSIAEIVVLVVDERFVKEPLRNVARGVCPLRIRQFPEEVHVHVIGRSPVWEVRKLRLLEG